MKSKISRLLWLALAVTVLFGLSSTLVLAAGGDEEASAAPVQEQESTVGGAEDGAADEADAEGAAEEDATDAYAAGEGEEAPADGELAALMNEGSQIYQANCAVCHGAEGNEANGSHVEILAGNDRAVRIENRVIRRVVHGGTYMPPFGHLSDSEVAAVVTFVRNSWGHEYGPTSEEEVANWR